MEITIPTELRNTFYCEEYSKSFPALSFYEINQHKRNGGGYVFSIDLYPDGMDFSFLPEYYVIGSLTNGNELYTVVASYATGVTFDDDLRHQWADLFDASDRILSAIHGINGYTFTSSYVRPKQ